MSVGFKIVELKKGPEIIDHLSDLLIETVAGGGSVSFMHPLEADLARSFWMESLEAVEKRERIILGTWCDGILIGTLTLLLAPQPNQPHRAELAKMMTKPSYRRKGVARALVAEAERIAIQHGRSLITLDTATEDGAASFYESLGYQRAGEIPYYAYKPHGGLTGTILYWKWIGIKNAGI